MFPKLLSYLISRAYQVQAELSCGVDPFDQGGEAVGRATSSTSWNPGAGFASTHTPIQVKEVKMKRQVIQVTLAIAVSLTLAVAVGSAQTSVRGCGRHSLRFPRWKRHVAFRPIHSEVWFSDQW